jgi:hypothetical protein
VKRIASSLWAWWTPGLGRFSRIAVRKFSASRSALRAGPRRRRQVDQLAVSSTAGVRWGERLSTVKGPATRMPCPCPRRACRRGSRTRPWRRWRRRSPSGGRCGPPRSGQRGLGGGGPAGGGLARDLPFHEAAAGAGSPEGSVTSPLAVKSMVLPARPPVSTLKGVAWPRSAALRAARASSTAGCIRSQITSISALLAMDFSVMCGTRS